MAREGAGGDRATAAVAAAARPTGRGRQRNERSSGGSQVVKLPRGHRGEDEVRGVSSGGHAAREQLGGVDGEADQPPREGDGEVLGRRGSRSDLATTCRLSKRRCSDGRLLATSASSSDWAALVPHERLTSSLAMLGVRPLRRKGGFRAACRSQARHCRSQYTTTKYSSRKGM